MLQKMSLMATARRGNKFYEADLSVASMRRRHWPLFFARDPFGCPANTLSLCYTCVNGRPLPGELTLSELFDELCMSRECC